LLFAKAIFISSSAVTSLNGVRIYLAPFIRK